MCVSKKEKKSERSADWDPLRVGVPVYTEKIQLGLEPWRGPGTSAVRTYSLFLDGQVSLRPGFCDL